MTATISYGSRMTVQAMHLDIKLDEEIGDRPFALLCVPDHGVHGAAGFETVDAARSAALAQAADMIAAGLKAPIIREVTLGGMPLLAGRPAAVAQAAEPHADPSTRLDRFRNVVTHALRIKQKQLA